jgi:hypothetical protein
MLLPAMRGFWGLPALNKNWTKRQYTLLRLYNSVVVCILGYGHSSACHVDHGTRCQTSNIFNTNLSNANATARVFNAKGWSHLFVFHASTQIILTGKQVCFLICSDMFKNITEPAFVDQGSAFGRQNDTPGNSEQHMIKYPSSHT